MFGQTLNVHAQSLCMVFLLQLAMFVASTTRLLGFPQSLHHISEKKNQAFTTLLVKLPLSQFHWSQLALPSSF